MDLCGSTALDAIQEGALPEGMDPEQWRVHYTDVRDSGGWIEGHLHHDPKSHWMTMRDLENDILAGDYLTNDVWISVGIRLRIDIYDVVVDHCVQIVRDAVESIDLIDEVRRREAGSTDWRPILGTSG